MLLQALFAVVVVCMLWGTVSVNSKIYKTYLKNSSDTNGGVFFCHNFKK